MARLMKPSRSWPVARPVSGHGLGKPAWNKAYQSHTEPHSPRTRKARVVAGPDQSSLKAPPTADPEGEMIFSLRFVYTSFSRVIIHVTRAVSQSFAAILGNTAILGSHS